MQKKAQEETCDRVLKKAQGSMEKGQLLQTQLEVHSWKETPHWSRDIPEGTAACGGAYAGTGTALRGPWRGQTWEQNK